MRIVVPYSEGGPSAQTLLALLSPPNDFEARFMWATESYCDLLTELWAAGRDFAIVEQDIVVLQDTMVGFEQCRYPWCSAGYAYLGSKSYHGNGCVRYRASVMADHPDLMAVVAEYQDDRHTKGHWCSLDAAMQRELHRRRVTRCTDHGTVGHLHTVPSHGCIDAYRVAA